MFCDLSKTEDRKRESACGGAKTPHYIFNTSQQFHILHCSIAAYDSTHLNVGVLCWEHCVSEKERKTLKKNWFIIYSNMQSPIQEGHIKFTLFGLYSIHYIYVYIFLEALGVRLEHNYTTHHADL